MKGKRDKRSGAKDSVSLKRAGLGGSRCDPSRARKMVEERREEELTYYLCVTLSDRFKGMLEFALMSRDKPGMERSYQFWNHRYVRGLVRQIRKEFDAGTNGLSDRSRSMSEVDERIMQPCIALTEAVLPEEIRAMLFPDRGDVRLKIGITSDLELAHEVYCGYHEEDGCRYGGVGFRVHPVVFIFQPYVLTACSIAGAAFCRSSGTIAGVASILAFSARNQGSAIFGSSEASFMLMISTPVRIPLSAMK